MSNITNNIVRFTDFEFRNVEAGSNKDDDRPAIDLDIGLFLEIASKHFPSANPL